MVKSSLGYLINAKIATFQSKNFGGLYQQLINDLTAYCTVFISFEKVSAIQV